MKKICLILLILHIMMNIYALDMNLDIGDEENALNIDKYIEYLKQRDLELDKQNEEERKIQVLDYLARNEMQDIISEYLNNKVYLEFHLGFSAMYHFEREYSPHCNLSVKLNILGPKRVGNQDILGSISALEEMLHTNDVELSSNNQAKIDKIKDEIVKYDKKIIKRISLGISIPFYPELTEGQHTSDDFMEEHKILWLEGNYFFIADISLFISMDITDYFTVQLGYDIMDFNSIYFGITTDVSTPISHLMSKFLYYIEDLIYH